MADMTTPNIFTMPQTNGNDMGMGAITPLILGAALFGGRGGLFGNNNGEAAVAAAAVERGATVSEVQGIINGTNTSQDLGSVRREIGEVQREIWKAEGDLQTAITASNGTVTNQILQAQIASMQGQAAIMASVDMHAADIEGSIANSLAATNAAFAVTNASIAAGAAATALAAKDAEISGLRNTQLITASIAADGSLTRAAIADLKDSLPNARELQLQREVGVLEVQLSRQLASEAVRSGNVDVITNVNQTAVQTQQQQQIQGILSAVQALGHNQSAMATNLNIGGSQRGVNQTPTNVAGF
jgi:hypothetical protein